jgi:hypothetical protein
MEVVVSQLAHTSPRPSAGTRPDAMAPATQPRKNGVINDDPAKTTPNRRAWARVSEYLRKAKAAPRSTIPSRARSIGMISVLIAEAKDCGKAVHHVTST